ncbi:MAG: cytochrome c [Anaerolineae bacterium]|nr:cytochrome c [Anaerolineae bacterium]
MKVFVFLAAALVLAGCGTLAAPVVEVIPTRGPVTLAPAVVDAMNSAAEEPAAVSAEPTEAPTEVPPTAVPPTEVPTEQPTATPTATPTPLPPTEAPAAVGDVTRGEDLFLNGKDAAPACVTCHLIDEDAILIGPPMIGIAERAATQVEGMSAEEYLYASIMEPNAHLVPNTDRNVYAAGEISLMFQQYADYLTEEEANDLVAYMLSLE